MITEEQRIRLAYARRGQRWRYDWANPAYVFAMQTLEQAMLVAEIEIHQPEMLTRVACLNAKTPRVCLPRFLCDLAPLR